MLFKIDFTRPHLYEDVVTLNQGNLSTNNTLRCRIVTGGNDDVTGASIVCTFVINGKQIFESGKVVDGPRGIVDVVFPSEALVVGENTLEFLVNRIDGSVAQSPVIKYRVWQGLTTDEGVRADSNYPLLIELIGQANEAVVAANKALEDANSVISQGEELKASVDKLKADCIASVDSFTEESTIKIDNAISQNVAKVDAAVAKNEASVVKADAAAEKAILAANNSDTKTAENIKNVNAAIAAGTQDLEVKAARVDMVGVEHGSLKERLDSDFSIGDRSLKDYVIDLDNMKESQDFAYETDKGYLVCKDTQNGVVKDLKVYGKSLVNKSKIKTTSFEGRIVSLFSNNGTLNGFTIVADVTKNTTSKGIALSLTDVDGIITYPLLQNANTVGKAIWYFNKKIKDISMYQQLDDYGADKAIVDNIMILEGDHRSNLPNGYFEGIASVGNGNEIEVLSSNRPYSYTSELITSTRKNFNLKTYFNQGDIITNITDKNVVCLTFNSITGAWVNDVTLLKGASFTVPDSTIVKTITIYPHNGWNISSEIFLESLISVNDYLKQDKKTILFKDTDNTWKPVLNLRGIDENNCDIVDSGKGKLVKKYNQMNINKNLNIILNDATKTNTIAFEVVVNDAKPGSFSVSNNKCICSKFKNITYEIDEVGFSGTSSNAFVFRINKTDLQTQDVEGCKKWLETNSFDIVYELNEYKECEINPIYPESYVDETMILFGSGVIVPYASWKITSSLPNFVQNIEDRVCRLENDASKVNLANFTVALNMLDMKARLESLEAPIN